MVGSTLGVVKHPAMLLSSVFDPVLYNSATLLDAVQQIHDWIVNNVANPQPKGKRKKYAGKNIVMNFAYGIEKTQCYPKGAFRRMGKDKRLGLLLEIGAGYANKPSPDKMLMKLQSLGVVITMAAGNGNGAKYFPQCGRCCLIRGDV
jgi:hypothetical protein